MESIKAPVKATKNTKSAHATENKMSSKEEPTN